MDYKQTPEEFNEIPNEFSSDFVVETENVVTTEIPAVPENPSAPQNPLFAPEYEQAASDDRYNYGNDEPENEYTAEEQDNFEEDYSIEAADEYYGNNDDAEYFAPEDEHAATSDKFDVTDGCEKCHRTLRSRRRKLPQRSSRKPRIRRSRPIQSVRIYAASRHVQDRAGIGKRLDASETAAQSALRKQQYRLERLQLQ